MLWLGDYYNSEIYSVVRNVRELRESLVGWVERSEPMAVNESQVMGFAALNPSYELNPSPKKCGRP
jgi:hypothetical protein